MVGSGFGGRVGAAVAVGTTAASIVWSRVSSDGEGVGVEPLVPAVADVGVGGEVAAPDEAEDPARC